MSDKLRSDYTRYMEEIKPSQEFLSQLTRTLEGEQPRRRTIWQKAVPVAACGALLVLILLFFPRQTDPTVTGPASDPTVSGPASDPAVMDPVSDLAITDPVSDPAVMDPVSDPAVMDPVSDPIGDYAGATGDSQTLPFTPRDWRDDALSAESAPAALAEKMTASLEYLCCNEENKFTDTERADDDTVRQVTKLLDGALPCGDSPSGIPRYYMAVFRDGTVATFSVTDQGYIRISGDDGVYKKSEP